ncbi:PREDICTED: uncharacterized protein LOC107071427 isoform X2 [Polistes dominula]|uniref:Uncharacterized protein LOC107071427 isoform X2 n=1 Tax=Polistes dominula TaxID=743375 RepID=A0ABM1J0C0_POLDO|nr:PREDICTED: uncharacterized protein LOC107071427 isoform X2 [Polistes dominula]
MGVMSVLKWLRKDIGYRDRRRQSLSEKQPIFPNESYRNALQAFMDRRRFSSSIIETGVGGNNILNVNDVSLLTDSTVNDMEKDKDIENDCKISQEEDSLLLLDVPHVPASEIFEIGSVAGTEDRYLELIYAEWENTRISLKRQTHPECRNAVKADMEILTKIRHPNVLMLMALTQTEEHGLISILEPVDCTLYNYIHEQGERISVRQMARFAGKLADALRHAHMRGYIHSAISPHCVYLTFGETVKLAGWELAVSVTNTKSPKIYEDILRSEIIRWQAPELFSNIVCKENDIYGLALLIWEMCTMRIPWNGYDVSEVKNQYVQLGQSIPLDLGDSPAIIYSLLEVALQIDPAKRSIDLIKTRRLLQSLEIKHEYKEDECKRKEKKEINKTIVTPSTKKPSTATDCNSPSTVISLNENVDIVKSRTCLDSTKIKSIAEKNTSNEVFITECSPNSKLNSLIQNDRQNFLSSPKRSIERDNHKEMKLTSLDKKENKENKNNSKKRSNNVNSDLPELQSYSAFKKSQLMKHSKSLNRKSEQVELPKILTESTCSNISVVSSFNIAEDITAETNPRANLQRLKETLANKRERFFKNIETPQPQSPENNESKCQDDSIVESEILAKVKSRDYEPHKPASHKTSLEKKCNRSPGSYDSPYISPYISPDQSTCKQPYSQMPTNIKTAIMKPRVILSHPQGFFEASLWKKEKEICISKMWKEDPNVTQISAGTAENSVTKLDDLIKPLETCNVNNKSDVKKQGEQNDNRVFTERVVTESESRSEMDSLQVLKDALDRATEIICANKSIQNESGTTHLPSYKSCDNINTVTNNTYISKSFLNNKAYKLTYTDDIKDDKNKKLDDTNKTLMSNKNRSFDNELNSNTLLKENINDTKKTNFTTRENQDGIYRANVCHLKNSLHDIDTIKFNDKKLSNRKYTENYFSSMSTDVKQNMESSSKNCSKCNNKLSIKRRFSLPNIIPHHKVGNHSHLGKLPIRKADNSANTSIEDFYIDDDNLELNNLNVNMVLLNDDEVFYDNYFFDKKAT